MSQPIPCCALLQSEKAQSPAGNATLRAAVVAQVPVPHHTADGPDDGGRVARLVHFLAAMFACVPGHDHRVEVAPMTWQHEAHAQEVGAQKRHIKPLPIVRDEYGRVTGRVLAYPGLRLRPGVPAPAARSIAVKAAAASRRAARPGGNTRRPRSTHLHCPIAWAIYQGLAASGLKDTGWADIELGAPQAGQARARQHLHSYMVLVRCLRAHLRTAHARQPVCPATAGVQ